MARFGSIGTQYFDNAGDPLINGKLWFYDSGTNTAKATFADVNLSIQNPHPVPLSAAGRQPNIFFTGSARVILTDSDNVQIEVRDPVGGEFSEGAFSSWNPLTIYNIPDIVVGSDGLFYQSITNGNQDNDPTADAINWTQIKFIKQWNGNETYALDDIVQGGDGYLYSSTANGNLNNNPVTGASQWKLAVPVDVPPVIRSASKIYAYRSL